MLRLMTYPILCMQCCVWDRDMASCRVRADHVYYPSANRTIAHENAEEIRLVHCPFTVAQVMPFSSNHYST